AGNAPTPELLVRWIQNGIFHTRFITNSWNDDGTVNLPWMYEEVFAEIKKAMDFRVQIMPYMYNLIYNASEYYKPILKPTFYDFEYDNETFKENDEFMFGDSMLVASVVEENARTRKVYLPKSVNWYYYHTDEIYEGGKYVNINTKLEEFPLFIKEGSIIPINTEKPSFNMKEDKRAFLIYPFVNDNKTIKYSYFEDDGYTFNYKNIDGRLIINFTLTTSDKNISIDYIKEGNYIPPYNEISFILPKNEKRNIIINGQQYNIAENRKITLKL
ncbi:glycoside hydrolase family 31 protein, partial [Brachyspira pilosicoli]|uniref:glycoside hydrolase family 31 protein n=1 Tax=Brachyspira pilosicoli TaxID=52584 RepID=UPI0030067F46